MLNKILFIDDDPICSYLNISLVEELGIATESLALASAAEALQYLKQHYPRDLSENSQPQDLIFLDIRMPGMDGHEFLDALEKLEEVDKNRFIIIILTASLNPQEKVKAAHRRPLVHSCLSKPLKREDLHNLLAELTIAALLLPVVIL